MLVQEGKLSWDDKVQQYLPYFALYDPWVSREVTVRDLLSHRVGLGTFSGDVIWYKSNLTSEEIIQRAKHLPKAYDFRAGYGYSNIMYITAGQFIEKIIGKSWGDNVKERIFKITHREDTLRMEFEHSPGYAATLSHWHYDVWQIHWDEPQAWFTFGTVRFVTDSNMEVTGINKIMNIE